MRTLPKIQTEVSRNEQKTKAPEMKLRAPKVFRHTLYAVVHQNRKHFKVSRKK